MQRGLGGFPHERLHQERRTFPTLRALLLSGHAVAGLTPGCASVFQPVPIFKVYSSAIQSSTGGFSRYSLSSPLAL
ncbi:MAG: hypothetical protein F6J99_27985 [Moorea sp. SIO4G3]|nr:hypothetical protein [Moorena sp. SIO4G3]